VAGPNSTIRKHTIFVVTKDSINRDLLRQGKMKVPKLHQGSSSIGDRIPEGHIIFHWDQRFNTEL
jgi:hypothetical protein